MAYMKWRTNNIIVYLEDGAESTPKLSGPDTNAEADILIDEDVAGY